MYYGTEKINVILDKIKETIQNGIVGNKTDNW